MTFREVSIQTHLLFSSEQKLGGKKIASAEEGKNKPTQVTIQKVRRHTELINKRESRNVTEKGSLGFGVGMPAFSPSSSSSAVMDLERSVRVVLGALLGGGGAVEKRHGVEDEVEGEEDPLDLRLSALLASPRRLAHPVFTDLIWLNSDELDGPHLTTTLFGLHLDPDFFMLCSPLIRWLMNFSVRLQDFQYSSLCAARIPLCWGAQRQYMYN